MPARIPVLHSARAADRRRVRDCRHSVRGALLRTMLWACRRRRRSWGRLREGARFPRSRAPARPGRRFRETATEAAHSSFRATPRADPGALVGRRDLRVRRGLISFWRLPRRGAPSDALRRTDMPRAHAPVQSARCGSPARGQARPLRSLRRQRPGSAAVARPSGWRPADHLRHSPAPARAASHRPVPTAHWRRSAGAPWLPAHSFHELRFPAIRRDWSRPPAVPPSDGEPGARRAKSTAGSRRSPAVGWRRAASRRAVRRATRERSILESRSTAGIHPPPQQALLERARTVLRPRARMALRRDPKPGRRTAPARPRFRRAGWRRGRPTSRYRQIRRAMNSARTALW